MRSGWGARWVEAEHGRFFLLLPLAMGAAILVYFQLPVEPPLWVGATLLGGSCTALALGWRHPYARFAAILALAGALGFTRAEWRTSVLSPMNPVPSGVVAVSGFVQRIEPLPAGVRVLLRAPRVDYEPAWRRLLWLRLKRGTPAPPPGALVDCYAFLFAPSPPSYPGGWQQRRNDYFANIGGNAIAVSDLWVRRVASPDHFNDFLQNIRVKIDHALLATLPLSTGSVAVTLFTGDEQTIPTVERQDFVLAGLAHILAVAGLHVGIVMGLFFFLSRWLLSRNTWVALHWPCKPLAAVVALAVGAGYAVLTGAHLPILRSLAMACLITLGVLLGRRVISLRGLAIAAIALMLAMPEVVLSAGFQMSFSAVAALIAGYEALHPLWGRLRFNPWWVRKMMQILGEVALTSLLAGGASMAFAAYQFQQLTPYWIPANLIAVPLTAFWIIPLGLAGMALIPLHLAWLCFYPMGWGIGIMVWVAAHIAAWPGAQIIVQPIPPLAILLYAAGLAWLCIWRSKFRLAGIGAIIMGVGVAVSATPPDILVSVDAKLIAIHHDDEVFVLAQTRVSHFVMAQWRHVWGNQRLVLAQCSAQTCRLGKILYARVPVTTCHGAAILVSPVPQPGCAGTFVLDSTYAARNGASAVWITPQGHIHLRSDREIQGQRPWSAF